MGHKDSFAPTRPKELRVDWSKIGLTTSRKQLLAECIAECIGTFIILLVGDSTSAMTLMELPSPYLTAYLGTAFGWGLGVTFGIIATGSISGAHLNPAVTLSLAMFRGFAWYKVVPYIVAQVIGAMLGSLAMWSQFYTQFYAYWAAKGIQPFTDVPSTQAFFTQPAANVSNWLELTNQFYQTGILLFAIFAITDPYNPGAYMHSGLRALMIGFIVVMIGVAFGFLEGWPLNPARDFGPRVIAWAIGFHNTWPGVNNTWWVPILGPFLGGIFGSAIYEAFIRPFMPGVRAHGDTGFTSLWAKIVLKIAPSLLDERDIDYETDLETGEPKRKQTEWQLEVGPGGAVPNLSGIRGLDETMTPMGKYQYIYNNTNNNKVNDKAHKSPMTANSNYNNNIGTELGADLDNLNNGAQQHYTPTSILASTPTNLSSNTTPRTMDNNRISQPSTPNAVNNTNQHDPISTV